MDIHPISPIDENHMLYGNFIGLQYVFSEALNSDILEQSLSELIRQFPALGGRYDKAERQVKPALEIIALEQRQSEGSAHEYAEIGTPQPWRASFVQEPSRRDVLRGQAPLSTFTLTEFEDKSCIFGMAVSHMLTDAAGFHILARHLANIYTALQLGSSMPGKLQTTERDIFRFGSHRTKKQTLKSLKQENLPKPIPITGLLGRFVKTMIIRTMEKSASNVPICIHLTRDDVVNLKQAVLEESGEDWLSTNIALSAHFIRLMAKLSYGDEAKETVQIGQLLDLRDQYFKSEAPQSDFIGNAILIHIHKAEFTTGLQNTPRGVIARHLKQRLTQIDAQEVKHKLDLLADCLRHGYTNPGLDIKNPIIAVNNQSKMLVYNLSFGGQVPLRVIPQDVGDNIMFFPARDGGVEIYIRDIVNPLRQQEFLSPQWQSQIFDF